MIKATVLYGEEFTYTQKSTGEFKKGFKMYYNLEGSVFTFEAGFFSADQIEKAKAAVQNKSCYFDLKPDRNYHPVFVLK